MERKKNKKEEYMEDQNNRNVGIHFGGGGIASVAGIAGGAAIAVFVPWVILSYGQVLGQASQTTLVLVGVGGGIIISFCSAFFGLVMPTSVNNQWGDPEKVIKWEEWKQRKKLGLGPLDDENKGK
jgi:hypothetical protein